MTDNSGEVWPSIGEHSSVEPVTVWIVNSSQDLNVEGKTFYYAWKITPWHYNCSNYNLIMRKHPLLRSTFPVLPSTSNRINLPWRCSNPQYICSEMNGPPQQVVPPDHPFPLKLVPPGHRWSLTNMRIHYSSVSTSQRLSESELNPKARLIPYLFKQ